MAEEEQVKLADPTKERSDKDLEKLKTERKKKRKLRLLKETAKADKRGVCYLSRIPPRMDHIKLRQILSQYGELERIYLTPEGHFYFFHFFLNFFMKTELFG